VSVDPSMKQLKKEDKYFSVFNSGDEEIIDFPDYLLASRCMRPKVNVTDLKAVDEYVKKYIFMSADEIIALGYTDHIPPLVNIYGDAVFTAVHIPSAVCEIFDPNTGYLGFENGLTAMVEHPEGMKRLLVKCYEAQLEWAKAYAKAGAHGYIISESYLSADIAGPERYPEFMKDIHAAYFGEIARYGLTPMCMFWGDVNPHIAEYADIGINGLLVEESKKGFRIDVRSIWEKIGRRVCVFGNLDTITLLRKGNPERIRAEVERQASGLGAGFVTANGSPVAPGTPEINVRAFIEAVRAMKR